MYEVVLSSVLGFRHLSVFQWSVLVEYNLWNCCNVYRQDFNNEDYNNKGYQHFYLSLHDLKLNSRFTLKAMHQECDLACTGQHSTSLHYVTLCCRQSWTRFRFISAWCCMIFDNLISFKSSHSNEREQLHFFHAGWTFSSSSIRRRVVWDKVRCRSTGHTLWWMEHWLYCI